MTAQTGNRFTLVWGHIYSKVKRMQPVTHKRVRAKNPKTIST
ncbi:hypothetical protein M067_5007 [Bacteroides fragilis str. J-143-4]|nr:hypothetical protein M067_5163 [Bacteroides fragilis str. J-143-4]EXZ16653.1 hypothetical protein M067_5007 [Bacteroides fragilis str. J-143-4]